jgi:hypothetical protein
VDKEIGQDSNKILNSFRITEGQNLFQVRLGMKKKFFNQESRDLNSGTNHIRQASTRRSSLTKVQIGLLTTTHEGLGFENHISKEGRSGGNFFDFLLQRPTLSEQDIFGL